MQTLPHRRMAHDASGLIRNTSLLMIKDLEEGYLSSEMFKKRVKYLTAVMFYLWSVILVEECRK